MRGKDSSTTGKTAERIFQSRQDWENTFNTITDMITIHDKDYNIIKANRAARKILKLTSVKNKNTKCFKYYHGTDGPPEGCPSCCCLKTAKPAVFELFEPHLNMFIEIRAIPRFSSTHKLIGLIHIVRDITERKKTEESLQQSREELSTHANNLMDANVTLKVLLKQRENDKEELEEKVLTNIKILVTPYMEKLKKTELDPAGLNYINTLESILKEIISPFSVKLSSKHMALTPKEIQIAKLIKDGKQSKDIAEILHVSFETVNCHRQHIRKKLGIHNKKTNLRSYLASLCD